MSAAQPSKVGRYEVIDRLGMGGMGVVYLARDPLIDRTVAIKVLRIDEHDLELRERFAREARAAGRLNHSNIVTIYDVGEDDGRPFIAMEYVNGESLAELIRRGAPISLERKLQYVQQLCAGLGYAHRAGFIHRDIKPANLMLTAGGDLKILDFGLARLTQPGGLTQAGAMMGTPNYMSPEQVAGAQIDARSDIFAVGVVMYELLTSRRAFTGESVPAVLHTIFKTDALSIREHLPDADAELERIVATATRREVNQRYQNTEDIIRDLQPIIRRTARVDPPTATISGRLVDDLRQHGVPGPELEIVRRRSKQIQAHLTAAERNLERGDYEDAINSAELALMLDPDEPRARGIIERARQALHKLQAEEGISRARMVASQGDLRAASALVEHVLQASPDLPAALELRQELTRQAAESARMVERDAAVRHMLEAARVQLAEGAFDAARRTVLEALAYDPGNQAALALKEQVAALADQDASKSASETDATRGEHTIAAPPPASAAPPPAIADHTMFIPANPSGPGREPPRLPVRLTVLQCNDARVVNQSFDAGESFEIGREGRDLSADDVSWSRRHAIIEYTDKGYVIRDLGSTGGTFVNGRRVRPNAAEPLWFGARITIGSSVLAFSPASDTRLPDLTGAVVDNRYVLEKLLRTSAKGAIYAARQQTIALRFALKLLSPTLLEYPGYRERFRRAAEVAIELHHPHICQVQDYGETTIVRPGQEGVNTAYLCLRLMTGGMLADRLDAHEQIPLARVATWVDSLCDAIAYAHDRNIVHGDIKPAAIVFDDSANAYVTDFAIGQPREGDSTPGVIGTPAYMAPEQWDGNPSTPATDQFGLAALAYYMVTGVRPFEGQDNEEIRRRNFEHGPLPAHREATRHGREDLPPGVSDVLARGLAYSAGDRYADVRQFAGEFLDALSGRRDEQDVRAKPRVFLSYHRAGGAGLPLFIVSQLERHGIEVYLDVQRVDGAVKFPERLTREIQRSDVFVCLLGPETLESRWVRHEIEVASKHRKPMIPVFHEEYVLPDAVESTEIGELLSFDGIRLMDQQNLYMQEGVEKLARQVNDTVVNRRRRH